VRLFVDESLLYKSTKGRVTSLPNSMINNGCKNGEQLWQKVQRHQMQDVHAQGSATCHLSRGKIIQCRIIHIYPPLVTQQTPSC
jgi:hypothetical protein